MAVIFLIFSFLFLQINLSLSTPGIDGNPNLRRRFIYATLIFGTVIVLSTEILSFFSLFRFSSLIVIWVIILLGLIYWTLKSIRAGKRLILPKVHFEKYQIFTIVIATFIIVTLGVIAWIAPSSNYDSMTYHMSRVMHWMENGNVAPYPTNISRQIWQNPFAEYVIAQLLILSKSDRLANFVQFFSMLGSCVGVSLIAKELGSNTKGQLTASILALTIPMGILQSTTTQNDYVFTYWMVCFAFFTIRFINDHSITNSLWLGISLGLAMLTKALAYPYASPIVLFLAVFILYKLKRQAFKIILVIVSIVVVLNASFIGRNYVATGSFIGTSRNSKYANEIITLPVIASNIIRNSGLHTWTPFKSINDGILSSIVFIHDRILHIAVDDPRTTYLGSVYTVAKNPMNEDFAGNPFHLVLTIISLIIFVGMRSLRKLRLLVWYVSLLSLAFIVFSGYLKWQPFNSRLELAFFLLWTPFIATVISKVNSKILNRFLPLAFLMLAIPWVLVNSAKPIIPHPQSIFALERSDMLFFDRPDLLQPYNDAISFIKSVDSYSTGILLDSDDWEYPLWAIANYYHPSDHSYRFQHIILNDDIDTQVVYSIPEFIISSKDDQINSINFSGFKYEMVWQSPPLTIYKAK